MKRVAISLLFMLVPVGAQTPTGTIHYIQSTGQSLSIGALGSPAVSTTRVYNNLQLTYQLVSTQVGNVNTHWVGPFQWLVEGDGNLESPSTATANNLTALSPGQSWQFVVSRAGLPGRPLSEVRPIYPIDNSSIFGRSIKQTRTAYELTQQAGQQFTCSALMIQHGEADTSLFKTAGYYEYGLMDLQEAYERECRQITGQSARVPLFLDQLASWGSYGTVPTDSVTSAGGPGVALGQWWAARDNPDRIYLVGPKYYLPYADGDGRIHLSNVGYRRLGAMHAKAMKKVLMDGQPWKPLAPRSITRSGATITVRFWVPVGTLAIDTTNLPDHGAGKGFEYWDASGSPPAITNVTVSGDTATITLASTPTGSNQRVRYAYTTAAGALLGAANAVGGNIRDTDTAVSIDGDPLYDWAITFDEPIGFTWEPAASTDPVLFFSDLTDGPRTGGENNKGAYVCVTGRNFGATRGSSVITVGGVNVDNYPVWGSGNAVARGDDKACFQLGASVPTGAQTIQMTVGGVQSNPLPFYVRADGADPIYCVSDVGSPTIQSRTPSDTNNGHFGTGAGQGCFATVGQAWLSTHSTPGAIIYLHNITDTLGAANVCNGFVWCTDVNGTDENHMGALSSYPGSPSTLGLLSIATPRTGVRMFHNHYTAANLILRGTRVLISATTLNWAEGTRNTRAVGNDMECTSAVGTDACWLAEATRGHKGLGNYIHDTALHSAHGYMATAIPDGQPLDDGDSILLRVESTGTVCTAYTQRSLGLMHVGQTSIIFHGGPEGLGLNFITVASMDEAAKSFTFNCTVAAGTYDSSNYPKMYYTDRQKLFHTTYFGANLTNLEVGWNQFYNNWGNNTLNFNVNPFRYDRTGAVNSALANWAVPYPTHPDDPVQPGFGQLGRTTGCASGSCMSDRTYYVSMSWKGSTGDETEASHETAITMTSGQRLTMTAPPFLISGAGSQPTPSFYSYEGWTPGNYGDAYATPVEWCIFVGTSPDTGVKQGCYSSGVGYTEPTTGISGTGDPRLDWLNKTVGSVGGYAGSKYVIHDNLLDGGPTNGIQSNSFNPTPVNLYGDKEDGGGVWIYNNVIYRHGKSPFNIIHPTLSVTAFGWSTNPNTTCVYLSAGSTHNGPVSKGAIYIENNTCYDIGGRMQAADLEQKGGVARMFVSGQESHATCGTAMYVNNNVMANQFAPTALPFWTATDFPCPWRVSGQKNTWYNFHTPTTVPPGSSVVNGNSACVKSITSGAGSVCLTNNLTTDPGFVDRANYDLRPSGASAILGAGVSPQPVVARDFYGKLRAASPTLGAYEGTAGCGVSLSASGPYTVGQSVTITATASNCGEGTLTWTSSGLPTGLSGCNSVTGATCNVTGTVSAANTFSTSISVSDGGSNTASTSPSIVVNAAPTISTTTLPGGTQGSAYSQTLTTAGGTGSKTCAVTSGSLTGSGLTLNSNCTITGTAGTPATYSFTVAATDSNSVTGAGQNLSVTINNSGGSNGGVTVNAITGGRVIR